MGRTGMLPVTVFFAYFCVDDLPKGFCDVSGKILWYEAKILFF